MSGDLNMDGNRITGLPTSSPALFSSSSDASSWLQIVNLVKAAVSKTGDLMVADLN